MKSNLCLLIDQTFTAPCMCLYEREKYATKFKKKKRFLLKLQAFCCKQLCSLCPAGAPSPAGHLGAAGIWWKAGQHGYSRPRGRVQHHTLRVPLPRGVQDAKAAYSHTAWVAGCLLQDYPLSCVSSPHALGDVVAVGMHWVCLVSGAPVFKCRFCGMVIIVAGRLVQCGR